MAALKNKFVILFAMLTVCFSLFAQVSVAADNGETAAKEGYEAYRAEEWKTAVFLLKKARIGGNSA